MMTIPQSSLALLLVVAATSNGFSKAANLRQRNLGGTNVATYKAYEDYASAMLAAVNKQRATTGLSPLCLNKKLHIAAQGHSDDMASNDFMSHKGSDGSTMSQRITLAGYDWTSVAENVAAGQGNVDEVMQGWIDSPGHLENIMGEYTMFASAYTFNAYGNYQHYWSQEFGTSDTEACDDGHASSDLTPQQDASPYEVPAPTPYEVPASTPYEAPAPSPYEAPAATPNEVQDEAEIVLTPGPTPVTDAPATDAPAIEAPVTDAYDSVMPSATTPTPATDSPKGKECQVQDEAETVVTPGPTTVNDTVATEATVIEATVTDVSDSDASSTTPMPAVDSPKGKDCESNF